MNILVPTDFSVFADFALEAAIAIMESSQGEIHLYHSADIPDDWEDLPVQEKYFDEMNKAVALKARDKLQSIENNLKAKNIRVFYHYTGGKFSKNIEEILEKIKFDLIIMGSHGNSGATDLMIGSNTRKVLRKVACNVLVVKRDNFSLESKKFAFVSGLHKEDRNALHYFLDFLKLFSVEELHLLSIDTHGVFTNPRFIMMEALEDFKKIAQGYNVQTWFYNDVTVESGVRNFIEEHDIDLIGISNHKKKTLKRSLVGSHVEHVVNQSEIPVLAIDY